MALWVAGTIYSQDDVVEHLGEFYRARRTGCAGTPGVDPYWWVLLPDPALVAAVAAVPTLVVVSFTSGSEIRTVTVTVTNYGNTGVAGAAILVDLPTTESNLNNLVVGNVEGVVDSYSVGTRPNFGGDIVSVIGIANALGVFTFTLSKPGFQLAGTAVAISGVVRGVVAGA
jgi:hypothetical protein